MVAKGAMIMNPGSIFEGRLIVIFCEVQFKCGGLCRGRKGLPVALIYIGC